MDFLNEQLGQAIMVASGLGAGTSIWMTKLILKHKLEKAKVLAHSYIDEMDFTELLEDLNEDSR